MKWENRDINVEKWANIPKFSKLKDIATSVRLLELFFDDVLVDMVVGVGYTKLYSHKEKADIRFDTTNKKILLTVFPLTSPRPQISAVPHTSAAFLLLTLK